MVEIRSYKSEAGGSSPSTPTMLIRVSEALLKNYEVTTKEYGSTSMWYDFVCKHCDELIRILWAGPAEALTPYTREDIDKLRDHLLFGCEEYKNK